MKRVKQLIRTSGVTRTALKLKASQGIGPSETALKAVSR